MIDFRIIDADFFEVQISTLTPERYPRVYTSRLVTVDKVKIFAIDTTIDYSNSFQKVLFNATLYSDITVAGVSFANAQLLATELDKILYSNLSAFASLDYVNQNFVNKTEKGAPLGVATLGADGLIPNSQISTLFDDVIDVVTLPATGESGKIYQNTTDNKLYRWSGTAFIEVSSGVSQTYVDTKLSKTSDDTANGIITFLASPLVPDANDPAEVVNFRQLETKIDKYFFEKKYEYKVRCLNVGYFDINIDFLGNFFGSISLKVNKNLENTSNVGYYEKLFYNIFASGTTLNTVKSKLLFNDEIYIKAEFLANTSVLRVYYNEGLSNSLLVTLDIRSTQNNFPDINVSPYISDSPTVLEPKTLIQTYNPDAPVTPVQSTVGNITFTDFDGGIFIDLVTARQYVQTYTTAIISEESFSGKTYRFTVPKGTAMLDSFLRATNSRFEFNDELGYISNYGNFCLTFNQKQFKATLGDFVTVGTPFLNSNQERFEFTAGKNFTAGQNCINQNIKYFKAKFGAFANLGLSSINGNFETFNVEIGDNSYLNGQVLSSNKKLFNAKIGSNCFLNNYAFYNNQLGFTATLGDNITFSNFAFNDNIAGIIDVTFGNFLTTGADFYKNNASQNIIKIGNNATIGTIANSSLSSNNFVTAKIGNFLNGINLFQNGANELITIGDNATITGNSFFDSSRPIVNIGNNLICSNLFIDSNAKRLIIESIFSATNSFNNLSGRLQIYSDTITGNIGQTVGQDFTNCFQNAQNLILILPTETETCNAGQPDGDIQVAIANGIDINNNLRYIL